MNNEEIKVIEQHDPWAFKREVNSKLKEGFTVSSTAILPSEQTPAKYIAILVKKKEQIVIKMPPWPEGLPNE